MDEFEAPGGFAPGALSVLVLGGYGLIGSALMRRLAEAGHRVAGAGRSLDTARKCAFDDWRIFDVATMSVEAWRGALDGFDVVVNAAGALQDGSRDDLVALHETALSRLSTALSGSPTLIVQISAAGVSEDASTAFFRTKARGDSALRQSGVDHVILRPTLVLAPTAYGGTALLRAGASIPGVLPKLLPEALIQCVHVDDLAEAVLAAVEGRIVSGSVVDVTGHKVLSLPGLLRRTRAWLGFREAVAEVPVPKFVLSLVARGADVAGRLGWRSPLRSTALTVLADGVRGDPAALERAGGPKCRDLEDIFRSMPATLQDRWFARAFLLFPVALLTLSLFWIVSGLIGLVRVDAAAEVLVREGFSRAAAMVPVIGGSLVDIALGVAILFRRWAQAACLGMIGVSLAYLAGAAVFAPALWADPLGPMVKVAPSIVLTLFALAFLEDR